MTRSKWLDDDKPRHKAVPPMLRDGSVKDLVKKAVDRQEDEVASALGGRKNPASGSMPGRKGDNDGLVFKGECKLTLSKRSMKIEMGWFEKIWREAHAVGKKPIVSLRLENQAPGTPQDWAVITLEDMEWLLRQAGLRK